MICENNWDYDFVIIGEPASSKNQRQIVRIHGIPRIIKSRKALLYSRAFASQCPTASPIITGDVSVRLDVYYHSRRPDLAAMELIKDLLQGRMYANDKQVKAQMELWNLDKDKPRVRVRVRALGTFADVDYSSVPSGDIWGSED